VGRKTSRSKGKKAVGAGRKDGPDGPEFRKKDFPARRGEPRKGVAYQLAGEGSCEEGGGEGVVVTEKRKKVILRDVITTRGGERIITYLRGTAFMKKRLPKRRGTMPLSEAQAWRKKRKAIGNYHREEGGAVAACV